MEAIIDTPTAMVITREIICEAIFRRRKDWTDDHPNRSLKLRAIPLDILFKVMHRMPVEKQPNEMTKDELRAYASRLLDETLYQEATK